MSVGDRSTQGATTITGDKINVRKRQAGFRLCQLWLAVLCALWKKLEKLVMPAWDQKGGGNKHRAHKLLGK